MASKYPSLRSQRTQGAWYKTKPAQRVVFLILALTTLFFILHSGPSLQDVDFHPDRVQSNAGSRGISYGVSSNDLASGRNSRRSPKPRAAFVALIRERQLSEILPTMRDIQYTFNDENGYDYIFLSETAFTPWFKDHITDFLSKMHLQPKASFGLIPSKDWDVPSHIDIQKAKKRWATHMSTSIPYSQSTTYRQMCRYMSGPIFQHPLLKDLDYYWRLEPETKHLCTFKSHWRREEGKRPEWIERDPFRYMRDNQKKYTYFMTMSEYRVTVLRLMVSVNKWREENPAMLASNGSLSFISDDGRGYNLCHYWSNFEIIDLSFVRSEAYTSYFKTLDEAGGFFYERWGDAPVRSIAASLMLNSSEVWHIDYAGYFHPPITQCPRKLDPGQVCACDPHNNVDYSAPFVSCRAKADKLLGLDAKVIVHEINKETGVEISFKEGEHPYIKSPPRLKTSPIL